MNIVLEYIKYRLKAKGRHGIHSPFVYKLLDECFQMRITPQDRALINKQIHLLKNDSRSLMVEDFGAGSHKLKKQRKVRDILRVSSSKGKYGRLLYQLSAFYKPGHLLEFGTSLGIGSLHLALGNKDGKIETVEACAATREVALEQFEAAGIKSIHSIHSTFDAYLTQTRPYPLDLIFVDGHHDGDALIGYLERLKPFMHAETLIIADDIRWSNSMLAAWNKLCQDSYFHVSLDLFRMGILSPRSGQEKEHFVVRY